MAIDYTLILGIIISTVLLGLPLFLSRHFLEEARDLKAKRTEIQKIYETYEEQEVLPKLSNLMRFVFDTVVKRGELKISLEELNKEKPLVNIANLFDISKFLMLASGILYQTIPDKAISSQVNKHKTDLKEVYKKWFEINRELTKAARAAESLGYRLIGITLLIALELLLVVYAGYDSTKVLLIAPIFLFIALIGLWQGINSCQNWIIHKKSETQYDEIYSKYPPDVGREA